MADVDWDASEGISRSIPDDCPTWDILICSIAERTDLLKKLLAELKRQLAPGVGVLVFRDNKQTGYGSKCDALLKASTADYVNFLDDDDWPMADYVASIREALMHRPDYVGFKVKYTADGVPQCPVHHTLSCGGWYADEHGLWRDLNHFNPIRRELALAGQWEGGDGADNRWADQVRASGRVREQVFIDREMLHYRFRWSETFIHSSMRPPLEVVPHLPKYRWATWIGG